MLVKEVAVAIHEKRAHPFEHGHFDTSVTLMAELEDSEDVHTVIVSLRETARFHVQGEVWKWEDQLREQRRINELIHHFEAAINSLDYCSSRRARYHAGEAVRAIRQMPAEIQNEHRSELRSTWNAARTRWQEEEQYAEPIDQEIFEQTYEPCEESDNDVRV